MVDIVETLRAAAKHPANGHGPQEWLNEAADEITRLRAALREIADGMGETDLAEVGRYARHIARAALEERT